MTSTTSQHLPSAGRTPVGARTAAAAAVTVAQLLLGCGGRMEGLHVTIRPAADSVALVRTSASVYFNLDFIIINDGARRIVTPPGCDAHLERDIDGRHWERVWTPPVCVGGRSAAHAIEVGDSLTRRVMPDAYADPRWIPQDTTRLRPGGHRMVFVLIDRPFATASDHLLPLALRTSRPFVVYEASGTQNAR